MDCVHIQECKYLIHIVVVTKNNNGIDKKRSNVCNRINQHINTRAAVSLAAFTVQSPTLFYTKRKRDHK